MLKSGKKWTKWLKKSVESDEVDGAHRGYDFGFRVENDIDTD